MIFFFNDTATTEIYTLSLHDALPIWVACAISPPFRPLTIEEDAAFTHEISTSGARILLVGIGCPKQERWMAHHKRSEEHTSELQSRQYLVCRLLLEKKKKENFAHIT